MSITASQEQAALDSVPTQLLIGGEWRDAGASFSVEDPATGESIAQVADATPDDAKAALDACVAVQDEWAAHPPRERGEILRRAFEAITARADELALVMTLEMGKPVAESKAEVTYASEFLRWFAEEAVRIEGVEDFGPTLRRALDLDVPSLIVLPIDYSVDVAISHELGTETVAA